MRLSLIFSIYEHILLLLLIISVLLKHFETFCLGWGTNPRTKNEQSNLIYKGCYIKVEVLLKINYFNEYKTIDKKRQTTAMNKLQQ